MCTLKENNRIIKDQAQVMGILKSYFKNLKPWKSNSTLASSEINHTCQIFQGKWNQDEPFEFNLINHEFNLVKTTIQRLKVNKAPGHDHIPPRALNAFIPSIARHLSHVITENNHHFETPGNEERLSHNGLTIRERGFPTSRSSYSCV